MASTFILNRLGGGDPDGLGWVGGELRDGLRSERIRAHLLRSVEGPEPEDAHVEGELEPVPSLPVGRAARLVLDDGRSSLIVIVGHHGRFHTVGDLS